MDQHSMLERAELDASQSDRTVDPVIEFLKKDIDVTLLLANLQLTPEQRVCKMEQTMRNVAEFRKAGANLRKR